MAQVSKLPLQKKVADRIYDFFLRAIYNLKNTNDVEKFLDDLLSPTEKVMICKRLAIAVMLEKGYSYETIAGVLRVSPVTIGKIALRLKYSGDALRKVAKYGLEKKKAGVKTSSFDDPFGKIFGYKRRGRSPTISETPYPFWIFY